MKAKIILFAALGFAAAPMGTFAQTTLTSGASDASVTSGQESSGDMSSGGASEGRAESGTGMQAGPVSSANPQPITQNEVTYLCGGVGEQEQAYMKQQAKSYDMMLTFATRGGAYLANVDVDIRDSKGNDVLQANCDGPMMLVDLPRSGTYRVRAEAAGYTQNRTIKVAAGKNRSRQTVARAVMVWPQQLAEGPGTATSSGGGGAAHRGQAGSGMEDSNNGAR